MINKPPTGLGWIFRSPLNKSGVGIQLIGDSKFSSYDAISYQNSIHHAGLRAFAARGTEAKPLELANDDVAWFAQAQSYDSNFKSFLPKGSLEAVYKSESDSLTWVFDRDVIAASFTGDGSGLTNVNFDEIEDKPWNWTASHTWITSDNLKIASFTEDGIVFGDADGGFQGPGTINAQAIYENGTLLTGGSGGSGGGSWGEITGTLSDQTDLQGALDTKLETETDPIFGASPASGITSTNTTNWNTAFGWGNHAAEGYLTSETDPTVPTYVKNITTTDISNWNTAFGWGDHAAAGYIIGIDWGEIGGTLANQLDLQNALDTKLETEVNDLSASVTWVNVPNANITQTSVTQHEAALAITAGQVSGLATVATSGSYNDLLNQPDLSVFDELEVYLDFASFPASGEAEKVYISKDNGYLYRWDGTAYVQLTDQTAIWSQITGDQSTVGIAGFTNDAGFTTYGSTDFDTDFGLKFTTDLSEGTNLYFTDVRAVSAIQADASWNAGNWDTAFSWGNHALAGYLTAEVNDLTASVTWADVPLANIPVIGPAKIDLTQAFAFTGGITLGEYTEGTHALTGSTPAIDPANGTIQTWTLGANSTPTSGLTDGQSVTLMIDDGTDYTITWTMVDQWIGGSAPTLATTGFTVVNIWNAGGTVYGALIGELS